MLFGISTALMAALAFTFIPAQRAGAQGAPRVQIALVDSLSTSSARAELVRYSGERPDLILLRTSTVTRDDLIVALIAHSVVRGERPVRTGLTARTTLVGSDAPTAASERIVRHAGEILRALKAAPSTKIGNLGRGRWGEFDAIR